MKKTYPERMTLTEVWPLFEGGGLIHLATIDGDHPRVRMVSMNIFDKQLWVVTKSGDDKVTQIRKNPNVEFTLAIQGKERTGCLRVTGTACVVSDQQIRKDVASSVPWFSEHWKSPQDSNFTLIRLDMKKILFDHHETSSKYTIQI